MKKWFTKEELQTIKPWLFLGIIIIICYLALSNLDVCWNVALTFIDIMEPLLLAIAFAYILNIPMMMIEKTFIKHTKEKGFIRKRVRGISITLTLILAVIIIALIVSIILPKIFESLTLILSNMGRLIKDVFDNIDNIFEFLHIDYRMKDISEINELIKMPWDEIFKNLLNMLGTSANGLIANAMSFTSTFFTWFLAFMFSLYLLNGKETLIRQLRKVCIVFLHEEKAASLFGYGHRANIIFKNFITGQLTEAVLISIIYYIGMRVFQFPFPELIAVIIGLFSLVPVFGPMVAMVIGALLVLSQDVLLAVWFIVFFQVLSQIEDNLIYPRVVGNSVGLPGLWVILSIFILGDMFGIVGMITAVPLTAFAYTLFGEWVHTILRKRKIEVDVDGFVVDQQE